MTLENAKRLFDHYTKAGLVAEAADIKKSLDARIPLVVPELKEKDVKKKNVKRNKKK